MSDRQLLAIVGSREFPDLDMVRRYVQTLPGDTIIVSGGARGVDFAAESEAERCGLLVITRRPDYEKNGRSAPLIRNTRIAEICDAMVAFWDGTSTGTGDAMRKARALGKPVTVFTKESVR